MRQHLHSLWGQYHTTIIGGVLLLSAAFGWISVHQYLTTKADFSAVSTHQRQQIEQTLQIQENILQTIAQLTGPAELFQQKQIRAIIASLIAPYPQIRGVLLFPTIHTEAADSLNKLEDRDEHSSPVLLYLPAHRDDSHTLLNQDAQKIPALHGTIHATTGPEALSSLPYTIDGKSHYFLLQRAARPIGGQDQSFPWYAELHVGLLIDPATLISSTPRFTTTLSLYNPINEKQRPLVQREGIENGSKSKGVISVPITHQARLSNMSQPFLVQSKTTIEILALTSLHWAALGFLSIAYWLVAQYRTKQSVHKLQQQMSSERRLVLQTQNRIRMLNAISHDLRTPLTRLQLRISTLLSGPPQEKSLADIGEIQQLIDHSLGYLRDEELKEDPEIIDMNQLITDIQQEMGESSRPFSIRGKAHWRYLCQPLQLRRAIQNLLNNAFRYGEQVKLLIEDGEQQLTIRIIDDGPGIDSTLLEKVTIPYYRADSSRNRQSGGIGLGLAIVQEITESHAGTLTLENLPEGGLSAAITLPR